MPSPAASSPDRKPWEAHRFTRAIGPLTFLAALIAVFFGLAQTGLSDSRARGALAALSVLIGGTITPSLYLLAAIGLGRPLARLLAFGSGARFTLQLLLGIAAMLWLSHLGGTLGLFNPHGPLGPSGSRIAAWGALGVGLILLAHQVCLGDLRPERWPVFPIGITLWAPAIGILLIAACSPPGALWGSEFGGYDVQSYHLQLAKEWAAGPSGRVWPVEHNVYSFLPSYMEAAFAHLGTLVSGFGRADGPLVDRMMAEDGYWLFACQFLHAGLGVVTAIALARLLRTLAAHAGLVAADDRLASLGGLAGAALLLGTPWTIVVGSLAYNELATLALMAGALLAAADADLQPWRRGTIAGLLVGMACSAKPTSLFLVGPAVGLALLAWPARTRPSFRSIVLIIACGSIAGLAAMAPWLIRNAMATGGNPVFPFATRLFGRGHWTAEQVDRYMYNHAPHGSMLERLELLVGNRGFGHEQWAFTPWMALVALGLALAWRPTRWAAGVLAAGVAMQLVAWLLFTHLQSRFLLPALVPMAAIFGLGVVATLALARARVRQGPRLEPSRSLPWLAAIVVGVLPLTTAGWSAINFMRQLDAQPNALLVAGPGALSGMVFGVGFASAEPEERKAFLAERAGPTSYLNLGLRSHSDSPRVTPAAETVSAPRDIYLLGDAAALYYLDALGSGESARLTTTSTRVYYHTTWDRSLLGDALEASTAIPPGTVSAPAVTQWFRDRGIGYVLVNYSELARLIDRDHYYDPRVHAEAIVAWLTSPAGGARSVRKWTRPIADGNGSRTRAELTTHELFQLDAPTGDTQ